MVKFKFTTALAIISVLGFAAIFINAVTGADIGAWVDSLLFIIIGFALFVSGGFRLFFDYFKDGLTYNELNKIVSVFIGLSSMIVGFMMLPLFDLDFEVFSGIKMIISGVAIVVITFDALIRRNRC